MPRHMDYLPDWPFTRTFKDVLDLDAKYHHGQIDQNPFFDGPPSQGSLVLNAHGLLITHSERLIKEKQVYRGFYIRKRPSLSFLTDRDPATTGLATKLERQHNIQVFCKKWNEDPPFEAFTIVQHRHSQKEEWRPNENFTYLEWQNHALADLANKVNLWAFGVIGREWDGDIDFYDLLDVVLEDRAWSSIPFEIVGSDGRFHICK